MAGAATLGSARGRARRRRPGGLLAYQDVGEVWYECTIVEKDEPLERGDRCLAGNPVRSLSGWRVEPLSRVVGQPLASEFLVAAAYCRWAGGVRMELKCGGQCPKGAARYARLPAETSGGVGEAFNCENRTSSGLGISRDRSPTRTTDQMAKGR
eukprot:1124825-Prorocentrum_minimum.AAC.3